MVAVLMALAAKSLFAQDICASPVKTQSGLVKGMVEKDGKSCVWRGIPYAAAPVGDFRWKAPAPAKSWAGVREAATFGHRCMQSGGLMGSINSDPSGGMSEDCLFLNIWRPRPAERGGEISRHVLDPWRRICFRHRQHSHVLGGPHGRILGCGRGFHQLPPEHFRVPGAPRAPERRPSPERRQLWSARPGRGA